MLRGHHPCLCASRTVLKPAHGEIFTKGWVVDLIFDLCAYTADQDLAGLAGYRARLRVGSVSWSDDGQVVPSARSRGLSLSDMTDSVRAFDLLDKNVLLARETVVKVLAGDGWDPEEASTLAETWVHQADYLLRDANGDGPTDLVVGNPPYIRIEEIAPATLAAYRAACTTMTGRSDIYVGFIEHGLRSLRRRRRLGFIVADRWMRNSYGRRCGRCRGRLQRRLHDRDARRRCLRSRCRPTRHIGVSGAATGRAAGG